MQQIQRNRSFLLLLLIGVIGGWVVLTPFQTTENQPLAGPYATAEGRWEYLHERLADPVTGEIPENIRMRELSYAAGLPSAATRRDSVAISFEPIGPYNVGGRTRAFAIDLTDPDTYIAGGVSGGVWRTTDAGQAWTRVSREMDHPATSCIIQDPRDGKTNTWYYGSGETVGNSASKSFSAMYRGNGMWKSTDGGVTWNHLQSTSALAHKASDWEVVHNLAIDPVRLDSDLVYAATKKGIFRSNDGGAQWQKVLTAGSSADFTRVAATSDGVLYAAISSDASFNQGLWRSTDGLHWVNITPQGYPGGHERTIISVAPSNEDVVYWFTYAPGVGANNAALWKYTYLSGDGSGAGGQWDNRTPGMASASYNLQGAYCQVLAVKPDDEDVVFLGGTNLYRSTNGFADTLQVTRIGGYSIDGDTVYNYFNGGGKHYPDQQNIAFRPDNPDALVSTTDGGVHIAEDCMKDTMEWVGLNNGYVTSQFYGMAIDHGTPGSEVVIGGTQDRGTHWTNVADDTHLWSHVRGADGAYCEVEDGAEHYYISTQYANIERCKISSTGEKSEAENIMPKQLGRGGGAGWLFVHPFTLDKANNDVIYLPYRETVWRNTRITETDSTALFSDWREIADVGSRITAIASSPSHEGIVYVGTTNGRIFRLDSAHTFQNVAPIPSSDSILNGGYTACIAIDPNDPMKAMAIFSNYNCRSIWYTEDGGADWEDVEGNLVGERDENVPENLWWIGNGPSIRWAEIVPTEKGNRYIIGTSVGVFSTSSLEGEWTEWVQQGSNTVGNVVVDMLKYRTSDGWIVAGTHGNGMYAGHVSLVDTTTPPTPEGMANASASGNHPVWYPNPASHSVYVDLARVEVKGDMDLCFMDQQGRVVRQFKIPQLRTAGPVKVSLDGLSSGNYFARIQVGNQQWVQRLIVQ